MSMECIGVICKEYRRIHKLTQRELALIIGISQGTISNYETGKHKATRANVVEKLNLFYLRYTKEMEVIA